MAHHKDIQIPSGDSSAQVRRPHPVLWTIYGAILVCIIAGISYYLYLVMTGAVYSYGHDPDKPVPGVKKPHVVEENKKDITYADTEQVKELTSLPTIENKDLSGDDNLVQFRNQDGSFICAITTDFRKHPGDDWIPTWTSAKGEKATGPGVECASGRHLPLKENIAHSCSAGAQFKGWAFGLSTNEGKMPGMCWSKPHKLNQDFLSRTNQRNQVPVLPHGYRAAVGHYSCAFDTFKVTCLDVTTGKGMTLDYNTYNYFGF